MCKQRRDTSASAPCQQLSAPGHGHPSRLESLFWIEVPDPRSMIRRYASRRMNVRCLLLRSLCCLLKLCRSRRTTRSSLSHLLTRTILDAKTFSVDVGVETGFHQQPFLPPPPLPPLPFMIRQAKQHHRLEPSYLSGSVQSGFEQSRRRH